MSLSVFVAGLGVAQIIREGGTEWKVVCFVYQTFNFLASDPGNGAGCEALFLGLRKISVDRIIIYREKERERERW